MNNGIKEGSIEIMKAEIEAIKADIIKAYEQSGKKVSGEFLEGLQINYNTSTNVLKAEINGYGYLAGRASGKMPPVQNIKDWVINKGIFQIESDAQATGIAWAIAKKIAKEGTNNQYHLKIYEKIITPARIDNIIKKLEQFNVQFFVGEVTNELKLLVKNI
ncbi:hypothetical protein [Leeuwenhoekiella sp. NPDC079379]|uniref:hypothetical protein n=1 Tax=Leeuwenhoekiella sp. NPDC079379 TaxID=3364122 RepID=UPI0037CB5370